MKEKIREQSINESIEKKVKELLKYAGITINGDKPWDIKVYNKNVYYRALTQGNLGLGEAYMDKWWDANQLDQFLYRLLRAKLDKKIKPYKAMLSIAKLKLMSLLMNPQSKRRAYIVGKKHYDTGNELFKLMLDKYMNYSCGYWKNAKNLDEAQEAKMDLICRKLKLKKGETLLDIGCGWGGFDKYAAEKYGVKVVGITVSNEQAKFAREFTKGLNVEIRVMDYRNLKGKFDKIVSIGMFEHVGYKNYKTFFKKVSELMKENSLFLLHTIGGNKSERHGDPWFDKYIFPNGMIPSAKQITSASEGIFILEDWHNFGRDYDKTLMAWIERFNKNWDKIKDKYSERFRRMWNYYLSASAAGFRSRNLQLWQIVFSKIGSEIDYESVR